MKTTILDHAGKPVVLNNAQERLATRLQNKLEEEFGTGNELKNALGGDINMTTFTQVQVGVIGQKLYTVKPSDYVPVRVGFGGYATSLLQLKEYSVAGGFETGLINDGSSMARLASVDAAIDSQSIPVVGWAKTIDYSLDQLGFGAQINWDLVQAKETSRLRNWQLGIQRVAFLGLDSRSDVYGLLTLPNVSVNTVIIPSSITTMTADQISTLAGRMLAAYQSQSNYTAYPDRLVIPQNDWNGLAAPTNPAFPLSSRANMLLEAFKTITMNQEFKILPSPYSDQTVNGLAKNRYVLYRYDRDTLRMDIPVDYTPTALGTINGYHYQNVAHARFTGVNAYREREIAYFDYVNA